MVAVYARARLPDGSTKFHLMIREEIEEIRARALDRAYNKDRSPWTTDPVPMAIKCPIRRLPNQLPIATLEAARPLLRAVTVDEGRDRGMEDREVALLLDVPQEDIPSGEELPTQNNAESLRSSVVMDAEPQPSEPTDERDASAPLPSYDDGNAPADVGKGKATIAAYLNDKSYQKLAHGVVSKYREATKRALTEFTIEDVAAVLAEIRKAVRG